MNRLRARSGPLWPYVVLVAIPTAAFVLPDLFGGHLLITGDNLQQNYPLRILVGSMVSHGQLPFWNQYIFSGTPLMADFNAGAFYPLTGLFAVMPDRAAWIATEVDRVRRDRRRDVRLPAGAGALDGGLPPRRRDVRVRRARC